MCGAGSAIPGLFGTEKHSDCDVLFCLEGADAPRRGPSDSKTEPESATSAEASAEATIAAAGATTAACAGPPAGALVGMPLPAHMLVLRLASERFCAQIERWNNGPVNVVTPAAESSSASAAARPQLRVLLGCEAEVLFARAAIGYAYTGVVAADGVKEALLVRRQAAYPQIKGCAAACDSLLLRMLPAACISDAPGGAERWGLVGKAAADADHASSSLAIEFMACWALLPDPAEEPTFAPVLAAANEALVRHFGDALAALNTPSLRQQLLQLPAAGVEALLGSEAFGTDSEDSVLLLLATWMKANHGQTDAATRERLCRLVRLVQLGGPYLAAVLPALAADYETGAAGSPCAWFPISVAEAAFIATLATISYGVHQLLSVGAKVYDTKSPWYGAATRPTCLSGAGRSFEWAISQQELLAALGELEPEEPFSKYGSFAGGSLCTRGFEWKPYVQATPSATSADLNLSCDMPAEFDVPGSRLGRSGKVFAVVGLDARLAVYSWSDGIRQDAFSSKFESKLLQFGAGWVLEHSNNSGWRSALPLAQPPEQVEAAGGGTGTAAVGLQAAGGSGGGGRDALVRWAAYLHAGRLTGTLTLLPAPHRVMRSRDCVN
ncbi:hypothetical protein TSOC_004381 [Tetrabaena socialis]|uniref:BACK domain-containing protein n=1 Tax=Tetrabaena socialis TaxID=47790 RepID=A0A2J8A963_9CHLO|nr:hypothetical protein TSOC_004381 [Tetrabaena socialis]|eukprot:PNH09041.1 hypothetical protein TSOC_004381 [Tetrabaena socialis]